jgi:ketosteroid isomerase-like protein
MKKMIFVFITALLFGGATLNSCKETRPFGDAEMRAVSDTINQLMGEITGFAEMTNADSTFRWLSDDTASRFFSGGIAHPKSALVSRFSAMYQNMKSQEIKPITSRIIVFSPVSAAWIAIANGNYTGKDGRSTDQFLTETWIWQREPAGWKVVHYHESWLTLPDASVRLAVEKELTELAAGIGSKTVSPADVPAILTAFLKKNPVVYGATLAFAPKETDGKVHRSAPYVYRSGKEFRQVNLPDSFNYTVAEWYSTPVSNRAPAWSKPYFDAEGGEVAMITYSIPVYDRENNLTGVLTSDLEIR